MTAGHTAPTRAVVVSADPEHRFLLCSLLQGSVDVVVAATSTREALPEVLDGEPDLIVLDVDLHRVPGDTAAAAAALRALTSRAVVLQVGMGVAPSGRDLRRLLRGNSIEVREWQHLRRPTPRAVA